MVSSRNVSSGNPSRLVVIKPYLDAPNSPTRRRARRWLTVAVTFFCLFYGLVYAFVTPYLLPVIAVPVVVLALVVVWALPNFQNAPIRTMEWFFFALSAAFVLWPNYLALSLHGLPWITAVRVTQTPFVFLLAICASTSSDVRSRLLSSARAAPVVWILFLAYVLMQFLSIAISDEKSDSIQKFLLAQINWTSMFIAGGYLFLKPGLAERWTKLLWFMAIFIGLLALWEHHLQHVIWMGHVPKFLQIDALSASRIMGSGTRAFTKAYRSQATFTTSLGMAEFLALTIPFVIHYMITSKNFYLKLSASISVPFLLYVILISGSRLGVVGFAVSILLYTLIWGLERWGRKPSDLIGPAVVMSYPVIFAVALASSFFVGKIRNHVWGGGAAKASTQARIAQWRMGIPKIISHPLGHGINQGGMALGYIDPSGTLTIDSYYLLILMDFGPIGFLIYYGLFAVAVLYAFRWTLTLTDKAQELSLLTPVGISLATFIVTKAVFSNTDNHWLAFTMLGMVCALVCRARMHYFEMRGPDAPNPSWFPQLAEQV